MRLAVGGITIIMTAMITTMSDADDLPSDLRQAFGAFDKAADRIIRKFAKPSNAAPPDSLYHYTTDIGLKGILESGALWVSDVRSVNDPSELSHGISLVHGALDEFSAGKSDKFRAFVARSRAIPWAKEIQNFVHFFICSLNRDSDGDDLSQWRAYGDNGHGYALEFNGHALVEAFDSGEDHNFSFPIQYDMTSLSNLVPTLIQHLHERFLAFHDSHSGHQLLNKCLDQLSARFDCKAITLSLFFKHRAYRHENEFRLMQIYPQGMDPPGVKIRMRSHELIRYREFEWKKQQAAGLKRIIVGPAADYDKSAQFVQNCLERYHPGTVKICRSTIPYRP